MKMVKIALRSLSTGMEVDDFNERFIADCTSEANKQRSLKRSHGEVSGSGSGKAGNERSGDQDWTQDVVHEAEACKARMFGTPGNGDMQFEPLLVGMS